MKTKTSVPIGRLLSAKDASKETGIPYTTLRDLAFKGEIPVVRLGRAWYFDRADLTRLIDGAKAKVG